MLVSKGKKETISNPSRGVGLVGQARNWGASALYKSVPLLHILTDCVIDQTTSTGLFVVSSMHPGVSIIAATEVHIYLGFKCSGPIR